MEAVTDLRPVEASPITLEQYEQIRFVAAVKYGEREILFDTPNRNCAWRVQTLFDKEPDTIAWIGTFARDAVFVDIGANIGLYSIWAAMTAGARVFAFEPEAQNFALLNRNIVINRCNVAAFPLALSDETRIGPLFLSSTEPGGSCHNFGAAVDYKYEPMKPAYKQGAVAMQLDDLIAGGLLPKPDHIKIDVDGIEPKVVRGAEKAIRGAQSVLIETNSNLDDHRAMSRMVESWGFRVDPMQIVAAQRTHGNFKGVGNVIFYRERA